MSIFEYDREWEEELLRKEEFEAGRELGKELGEKLGRELGKRRGRIQKEYRKERRRADSTMRKRELLLLKKKLAYWRENRKLGVLPSQGNCSTVCC